MPPSTGVRQARRAAAQLAGADEIDAELIVIGSNRHGAIGTALVGSVSVPLLKRATRPVVVVHPQPVPAAVAGR